MDSFAPGVTQFCLVRCKLKPLTGVSGKPRLASGFDPLPFSPFLPGPWTNARGHAAILGDRATHSGQENRKTEEPGSLRT